MNDVLEDRLVDLFERAGDAVVVDDRLDRVDARIALEPVEARSRRRPWMLVAAAVVVVGAAGVVRVVDDRSDDREVAQHVAEPPGPLYLLPNGLPEWTTRNGSASAGSVGSYQGVVVGLFADEGLYFNVAVATLTEEPPNGFSTDTWREVSHNDNTVFISPQQASGNQETVVTQQRGTMWLSSASTDSSVESNLRVLEALEVDATGSLSLGSTEFSVIDSYDIGAGSAGRSTYFEAFGPVGDRVVVETISGEIPLTALVADRAFELESVTVNGNEAWHASGMDVDGEWHAIAWEFAPQQTVTVSNHDSYDTLLDVAESLEVVDEATWTAATS